MSRQPEAFKEMLRKAIKANKPSVMANLKSARKLKKAAIRFKERQINNGSLK